MKKPLACDRTSKQIRTTGLSLSLSVSYRVIGKRAENWASAPNNLPPKIRRVNRKVAFQEFQRGINAYLLGRGDCSRSRTNVSDILHPRNQDQGLSTDPKCKHGEIQDISQIDVAERGLLPS